MICFRSNALLGAALLAAAAGPALAADPCATADFEFDVAASHIVYSESNEDYFANKRVFELREGTTTVARVITNYQRLTSGSADSVSIENTFLFTNGLRLQGHASDDNVDLTGAWGLIDSALTDDGQYIPGRVRYHFSTYEGVSSMCFWVLDQ